MKKGFLKPYTKVEVIDIMSKYFGLSRTRADMELERLVTAYIDDYPYLIKVIQGYGLRLSQGKKGNVKKELVMLYPFYQRNPDLADNYVKQLGIK